MPAKPAIEGGRPVRRTLLPYGHQSVSEKDARAVTSVLRSDRITQGPLVERFEVALAKRCQVRWAVVMSSGTAALHAACAIAGLRPGFAGITSPITFSASANAVAYCGAKPGFVDVADDWPLMDVEQLAGVKSSDTKAVIPVDYAGHPAPLDEIRSISRDNGWTVIEDAAHSLGAEYNGRPVGSLSDLTVLSFHPVKQVTTGEGGAVLTDDEEKAEALRAFRHHGIVRVPAAPPWRYDIAELGHNFRLTDIQCALGLSQLSRLTQRVRRRREIARSYTRLFEGLAGLETPTERQGAKSSCHIYPARLRLDELRVDRRHIFEALRAEGLGVQVHYVPVHTLSFYQRRHGFKHGDFPRAEAFYEREITLPLFDAMTEDDRADVVDATRKILGYYAR